MNKTFKPKIDKLFYFIFVPTASVLLAATVIAAFEPVSLAIIIPVDLFSFYFLLSPLFGYVELREDELFIKFGFFQKSNIPYKKIRSLEKERKFICDSMLSLKNAMEHVNIRYNTFDLVTVSVKDNDELIRELEERMAK